MNRHELWQYELEVGKLPNGPDKFRQQDLIEMAKQGLPERMEAVENLEGEVEDLREQVQSLEDRLGVRL
jgi:polyhydroxyalkanoate synthesis regulator phasin